MIATTPPPPPVLERPAPYEVVVRGRVSGVAAPGTVRLVIRAGGRLYRNVPLRQRRFTVRLDLPAGETSIRVQTLDRSERRAQTVVDHVFGLPQRAAPRLPHRPARPNLVATCGPRSAPSGPYAAAYVQNLTTGAGAAWNARAQFPAASTLKLAIAVAALARTGETPRPGSSLDALLRRMLIPSDDAHGERWC